MMCLFLFFLFFSLAWCVGFNWLDFYFSEEFSLLVYEFVEAQMSMGEGEFRFFLCHNLAPEFFVPNAFVTSINLLTRATGLARSPVTRGLHGNLGENKHTRRKLTGFPGWGKAQQRVQRVEARHWVFWAPMKEEAASPGGGTGEASPWEGSGGPPWPGV